uniref:RGS domain-containing protein n=1 Tax=Anopheles albimanus TaxID=7167 RepID=A0A182FBJ6_ANOAL
MELPRVSRIKAYEKTECHDERRKQARDIYDNYIMKEMLSHTHEYSKEAVAHVQKYLMKNEVPVNLFEPYIEEIFHHLRGEPFRKFLESDKYTRFCQWKNLELNIQVSRGPAGVKAGAQSIVSQCSRAQPPGVGLALCLS